MNISEQRQQLARNALVTLFEIDCRTWNMGVLRFCSQTMPDGSNVNHNGSEYIPLPIEAEGFEKNGQGPMPEPTLKFSILSSSVASLLKETNNLLGAPVTRIRIFANNLDNGSDPDPTATFPFDHYSIAQKQPSNSEVITFKLRSTFAQEGKPLPSEKCEKNTCSNVYRYWDEAKGAFVYENATCPYAKSKYFDRSGNSVFDAKDDVCGKRLSDCQARYGKNATLPFTGMPGLRKY